jgi:hypothetical protein
MFDYEKGNSSILIAGCFFYHWGGKSVGSK